MSLTTIHKNNTYTEYSQETLYHMSFHYETVTCLRIGGDEFAAILEGGDFENRDVLLRAFEAVVEENREKGK